MAMSPRLRRFALTVHVTSSLGWFGTVAAFLVLAIAGLTSQNAETVRAAYLSAELVTWAAIVPLALATLLTGVLQSLGTTWGLFQHYWVVFKLVLTCLATVVLLVHTQPIGHVADVAADRALTASDLTGVRIQLVIAASAALVVLLINTVLAVYKPRGRTRYGQRRLREHRAALAG